MKLFAYTTFAALASTATFAQSAPTPTPQPTTIIVAVDCTNPANAANPACVTVPPRGNVQNFLLLPAAALAGLAAAAAAGGNTPSTTSTTP